MLQEFITQQYLIIELNVVTNVCVWNGDTTQWTPPAGSIQLVQATTPALIWKLNADNTAYELVQIEGAGSIGYTWDGTVLTTNEPQPSVPIQPSSTGTQTIG